MPTVTVSTILSRARQKADQEESTFCTDSELVQHLNDFRKSLFATISQKADPSFNWTEVELAVSSGLATLPSDFFKARRVEGKESANDNYTPLTQINYTMVSDYLDNGSNVNYGTVYYWYRGSSIEIKPSNGCTTIRLSYNAIPTDVSSTTDTISTIFHEDRYLVACLAEYMAIKEESDPNQFKTEKYEILGEIIQTYKVDSFSPIRVANKRRSSRFRRRRR